VVREVPAQSQLTAQRPAVRRRPALLAASMHRRRRDVRRATTNWTLQPWSARGQRREISSARCRQELASSHAKCSVSHCQADSSWSLRLLPDYKHCRDEPAGAFFVVILPLAGVQSIAFSVCMSVCKHISKAMLSNFT